jgi:1-acyl-sn-glycerol-3-phosphate acyltransferase
MNTPMTAEGDVSCGRGPLVDAITSFLGHGAHGAHGHAPQLRAIRATLEQTIDDAGPDAIGSMATRLSAAGADWDYYPRDPLARRIHHVLAPCVLRHDPVVTGGENLTSVAGQPLLLVANHLSYSDANLLDVALQNAGHQALCDRLTVVAGPKVYSNVRRRFSSLCFGTIKVPQNSGRSSEEAVMHPRDIARAARRAIEVAQERLRLGEALLVFAEGSRSRSGDMQPLLAGVARYVDCAPSWVVPIGLAGTERLFPIGGESLIPVPITVSIGPPVEAGVLLERARGNRRAIMDCLGFAIAGLLPPEYRGVYGHTGGEAQGPRRLASELFGG